MIDLSVIQAFESGTLGLSDFYFTGDDYRYRFKANAKQRFIDLIRGRFNAGVPYKARVTKWDTVIEQKIIELDRFLTGKRPSVNFVEPAAVLVRSDSYEIRNRILRLSQAEAERLKIGRSTLHYLRRSGSRDESFGLSSKVRMRIMHQTIPGTSTA